MLHRKLTNYLATQVRESKDYGSGAVTKTSVLVRQFNLKGDLSFWLREYEEIRGSLCNALNGKCILDILFL